MTQHIVHFHCQIDQSTSERFRDQCLAAVDQGASRLLLNMSTSGGSTNFGFTIYTFLKSLPVPLMAINAGNGDGDVSCGERAYYFSPFKVPDSPDELEL
jgi:ATP-dependent Clp protease protease subunit